MVAGGGTRSVLLAKPGRLTGPTWSPDGHWLLVGWPAADQWLFIPIKRSDEVIPIDSISEQLHRAQPAPRHSPASAAGSCRSADRPYGSGGGSWCAEVKKLR